MHLTLCVSKNKIFTFARSCDAKEFHDSNCIIIKNHARCNGTDNLEREQIGCPSNWPELDQFNRLDLLVFGRSSKPRNKKEGPLSRFSLVAKPVRAQYGPCIGLPYRK